MTPPGCRIIWGSVSKQALSLARRENKDDSADLMLEDEFIGVVFRDDEDGEVCFHVQISILEEDLDEV